MTDAAGIFKALGEQTRMRIAMLLVGQELCVCDLTEVLRLPQSTISRHMTQLRQSGLVADRREGIWIHYRLANNKVAKDISRLIANSFWKYATVQGRSRTSCRSCGEERMLAFNGKEEIALATSGGRGLNYIGAI